MTASRSNWANSENAVHYSTAGCVCRANALNISLGCVYSQSHARAEYVGLHKALLLHMSFLHLAWRAYIRQTLIIKLHPFAGAQIGTFSKVASGQSGSVSSSASWLAKMIYYCIARMFVQLYIFNYFRMNWCI